MSRILVVDNNPADIRLVQEALRELGRDDEIETARDGDEALAVLDGGESAPESFDLVLLDIRMPRCSGVEVLRALGDRTAEQNLVMLTTTRAETEHRECLQLGARRVLVKPSSFDELCTLLEGVLP